VRVGAAAPVEFEDDALRERARRRIHRLLHLRHPPDDLGRGDDPADAQPGQEGLRERPDRDDAAIERRERGQVRTAVAQEAVRIVLDNDRVVRRGEREEGLAAPQRERLAGGVAEVRNGEEDPRSDVRAPDQTRRLADIEPLAVDRDLEHPRAVVAERGERVREAGRFRDDDVAGPQEHPAGEVDRLQRSRRDEHVLRGGIDASRARLRGDDLAQLRLPLGDRVPQRARALAADHRRGEVIRADELERLAGRRADRERHGVACLPGDDPDRLVDERAVHLVVGACLRQRSDRAAGHRRQDLDGLLPGEVAVGPEEAHVLAVDEHVEEARHAVSLEHARLERREAGDERLEGVADGCGVDRDGSLAACFRPEHGRDADLRHATSKDKALGWTLPRP
jgi:hypothetical protein